MGIVQNNGWEVVDRAAGVERFKVYGGWLVKHREIVSLQQPGIVGQAGRTPQLINMAITFVPDAKHEWIGCGEDVNIYEPFDKKEVKK